MSERISAETWLPIPGMNGRYDVSDHGNIRSWVSTRVPTPHLLTPIVRSRGHLAVKIAPEAGARAKHMLIHRLVLLAFVGPPPFEGSEVRHLDGDPTNNAIANITYGTRSENEMDKRQHGTHNQGRKTHCSKGHEFTPENTTIRVRGAWRSRVCLTCQRAHGRACSLRRRGLAA